jgi:hypothetical protein
MTYPASTARERAALSARTAQPDATGGAYTVEKLLPALRLAAAHRREMLALISDNGGAIYTVTRILGILCERACFPELTHIQQHKRLERAEISVAAHAARKRGEPVHTEHVLPQRAFAKVVCELIESGASDQEVLDYIRTNFRLVTLTLEERRKVDRLNRTRITKDRIAEAGIKLMRTFRA